MNCEKCGENIPDGLRLCSDCEVPKFQAFICNEIGMTMGDTSVRQLSDGTWKATCPIGALFGMDVQGECSGVGSTKEAALEALAKDRKNLNDSLWY